MFFEMKGIKKTFGGLVANNDISLSIERGEIVGLIGPNGSGKSTLFNTITGFIIPDEGTILFKDKNIVRHSPFKICKDGIACTFQHSKTFSELELFETIMVGAYCRYGLKKKAGEYTKTIINYLELDGKENKKADKLNMFDRKKAELAAALATKPELLLLDELFAGCNPSEVEMLSEILVKINKELEVTFFIVEHVLKVIMSICQRVVVLDHGIVIAADTPAEIVNSKQVITAYLGKDYNADEY